MAFTERIRVEYADIDMMGHVNNAAYFTYMETARCRYYLHLTGLKEIRDLDIIVAAQNCQYVRGLRYAEFIDVIVWPTKIGTTSFTLAYVMRTATGEIVARAETVLVMFDYAADTKKPIGPTLRGQLESEMKKGSGIPVSPS